jgi:predicted dehydrogenase
MLEASSEPGIKIMRFALLGDHADGLALARALLESGRHSISVYAGPMEGMALLQRFGASPRRVADAEEALAAPDVEGVLVASPPAVRGAHLRRALQSEHHVLCVHPAGAAADLAYEASMLASDTGKVLLPILPWALHPALHRLRELRSGMPQAGAWRLCALDWSSDAPLALEADRSQAKLALPGWDILRVLGGEIVEIFAQSEAEEPAPADLLVLAGRLQAGTLLRVTLLPCEARERLALRMTFSHAQLELEFPEGLAGPATLHGSTPERLSESFAAFDPWPALVEHFERVLAHYRVPRPITPGQTSTICLTSSPPSLAWLDAIRAIELDENVRRSLHYGRSYAPDLQDASEEVTFKGTMTLVGCSLIWVMILMLILSIWLPWMGWLIIPLLGAFLVLQLLRYAVPPKPEEEHRESSG